MPPDATAMVQAPALVEVDDLARDFDVSKPWLFRVLQGDRKRILKAVAGVSFAIPKGTTLSLVDWLVQRGHVGEDTLAAVLGQCLNLASGEPAAPPAPPATRAWPRPLGRARHLRLVSSR